MQGVEQRRAELDPVDRTRAELVVALRSRDAVAAAAQGFEPCALQRDGKLGSLEAREHPEVRAVARAGTQHDATRGPCALDDAQLASGIP